jgi:RNA ligase-like protein
VVRLYGELFGGAYPHPAVPGVKGISPVQTGIWYAPGIHFALFDILVDDDGGGRFLAHGEVTRLATASGLQVPPLLHRGSRAEVDALPVRFPTRVPLGFRLPALADNFAEGLVIKPDIEARPADYVVFKRKRAELDETRLEESAPVDKDPAMDLGALTAFGRQLVNGPRFDSARSKLGEGPPQALIDEVILDVLVDLETAFPRAMRDLSPASRAGLRKELGQRATLWLTEHAG